MPTERLFAMRAPDTRVYVATAPDPRAHAEAAGCELLLETEAPNPARAVEYVQDGLEWWSLGDGWFKPIQGDVGVLTGLFGNACRIPPDPPKPKPDAIDAALRVELETDAPPPEVEADETQKVPEVEGAPTTQSADEPDAAAARLERRRRAIEAGLIRP